MPRPKKPTAPSSPPALNPEPIMCTWSLAELPSAQHRAGLAGLAMLVTYTRRSSFPDGAVLEAVRCDDAGYELRINRAGLKALFDKVYAASLEEIEVEKPYTKTAKDGTKVAVKPKSKRMKTTTDKKGKSKTVEMNVYDRVVPHGGPLGEWSPAGDEGRWLKLWRDWLWNTLRAIPKQRTPYNQRASGGVIDDDDETDGTSFTDETTAWSCLTEDRTQALASTYCLGAMDVNSDQVPFLDRGRFLFLLHFWPFAVHLFVTRAMQSDGTTEMEKNTFCTCIPDVARLRTFIRIHEQVLGKRSPDAGGFRPRQALIDLPEAAALEADRWLHDQMQQALDGVQTQITNGFQVIYAAKEGNSVRIRSNRIVEPTSRMRDLTKVAGDLWNHNVRRQVLTNALTDPGADRFLWWRGFDRLCAITRRESTIGDVGFRHDARILFEHFHPQSRKDQSMTEVQPVNAKKEPRTLEPLVLHLVQNWLNGRLKGKYGLAYEQVRSLDAKDAKRNEFDEKKGKLAGEAFLAARSRPGRDFARWFTATLCAVNQHMSEIEFIAIAKALEDNPDHVRSLTLLALSARG